MFIKFLRALESLLKKQLLKIKLIQQFMKEDKFDNWTIWNRNVKRREKRKKQGDGEDRTEYMLKNYKNILQLRRIRW